MKGRKRTTQAPPDIPPPTGLRQAEEAVQAIQEQLGEAKKRDGNVKQVARTLRELREENHFAEMLDRAFGGAS